ncbi:MAG TPA: hypothetical protein VM487_13520, partial [Phycisphaerae bacterium]|nr:hypothetical protein [Phycisphaerae bacterium]
MPDQPVLMDIEQERIDPAGVNDAVVGSFALECRPETIVCGEEHAFGAALRRGREPFLLNVGNRHPCTEGTGRLGGELPDQARSGNPHVLCRADTEASGRPHTDPRHTEERTVLRVQSGRQNHAVVRPVGLRIGCCHVDDIPTVM